MTVEQRIVIAAPPDRVYELLMDPARLEDWVSIHAGLKQAPNGALHKGSELTQCLKLAGQRFDVHWHVVQADRPTRVVWEGQGPVHSTARVVYGLEPQDGGTCFHYLNEYKLPGGPLARIGSRVLRGTTKREASRSLERLKSLLEG